MNEPIDVIVVEDNLSIRALLRTIVRNLGYSHRDFESYENFSNKQHHNLENIKVYMMDFNISYNPEIMTGGDFLDLYGYAIPNNKRVLMSGADGWEKSNHSGLYLNKPFGYIDIVSSIEDRLKTQYKENERK